MQAPRDIQPDGGDALVPSVDGVLGEDEGSIGHGQDQLDQNQFVEQDMLLHVDKGHGSHDQQAAQHEALAPCLEHEAIGIGGSRDAIRRRHWSLLHAEAERYI